MTNHGRGRGDLNASLSIGEAADGALLIKCFCGCSVSDIVAALGLTLRDLFPSAGTQAHPGRLSRLIPSCRPTAALDRTRLEGIAATYHGALSSAHLTALAHQLGVSERSLERLELGWDRGHRAWTFSMRDGDGRLTGFRLRACSGAKYTLRGTHEGLFLPRALEPKRELIVTEGPTDAAALLDLGLPAVGRPSCTGGTKDLVRLVRRFEVGEVVITADRDEPGQRGAAHLADALARYSAVRVATPPAEDIRDWTVGERATEADVRQLVAQAPRHRLCTRVVRLAGSET